jgi:hypothetical protein
MATDRQTLIAKSKADALWAFAKTLEDAVHGMPVDKDNHAGGYLRAASKARIAANEYLAAVGVPPRSR